MPVSRQRYTTEEVAIALQVLQETLVRRFPGVETADGPWLQITPSGVDLVGEEGTLVQDRCSLLEAADDLTN